MSTARRTSSSSSTSTGMGSTGSPGASLRTTPENDRPPVIKTKPKPPEGTLEHVVSGSETLESIAIKYDSNPSELVKLNRLALRMVFPGQKIFIPDKTNVKPVVASRKSEETLLDFSSGEHFPPAQKKRQFSNENLPFPGHIEAIIVPDAKTLPEKVANTTDADLTVADVEAGRLDDDCYARFLKINASLVTEDSEADPGSVSGVLLVTPNAIMFDPNVSDLLVVKNGTDRYGTIIPMENILSAAIYSEIVPRKIRKHSRVGSIPYGVLIGSHPPMVTEFPFPEKRHNSIHAPETAENNANVSSSLDETADSIKDTGMREEKISTTNDESTESKLTASEGIPPPTASESNSLVNAPFPSVALGTGNDVRESVEGNLPDVNSEKNLLNLQIDESNGAAEKEHEFSMSKIRKLSPFRPRKPSNERSAEKAEDANIDAGAPGSRSKKGAFTPLRKLSRSLMGRDSKRESISEDGTSAGTGTNSIDEIFQRTGSIRERVSPKLKSFVDYSSGFFSPPDSEEAVKEPSSANSEEVSSPLPGESFTTWQLRRGLSREELLEHASARRQKFGYRSLLTMDDKPELFRSIEDLIPHLHPHSASKPLYLCIRVGTPLNKSPRVFHGPVESYGKKKLKPEYWFAIEREKADKFYAFMLHWRPEVYGTENMDPAELGFMLFDEPDEDMHEHFAKDLRGMAKEWEVIAFDEARRRAFFLDREESIPLPELRGKSDILTDPLCLALTVHLPARAQGYPWTLVYNTNAHGFSLKTLYRKMQEIDSPTLFLVKDVNEHIFGAIVSCAFKVAEHFYGTGESALFSFHPTFRVYNWNGENQYIVRGQLESIAIGSGKGTFGLWLDGDLFHGRTQECATFDNEPLCPCGDFQVKTVEAWCFFTE